MEKIQLWLLQGDLWLEYRTRIDLLAQVDEAPSVQASRAVMMACPLMQTLVAELSMWPGTALNSYKDVAHAIHKLAFLADLGFQPDDPGMDRMIQNILSHRSPEGSVQVLITIPTYYGGSGEDEWSWMPCDAPIVMDVLLRFGLETNPQVYQAMDYLMGPVRDNGWPCVASPALGKFQGPGRKNDPCPYVNLVMLKGLSQAAPWRDDPSCRIGAETLLSLWERWKKARPYLFAMGTDVLKLTAPLIWGDILYALELLAQFPWLNYDPGLMDMIEIVQSKMDDQGRFTPESIWLAWKGWEFGQKKQPSQWLTFLVYRILKRLGDEQELFNLNMKRYPNFRT